MVEVMEKDLDSWQAERKDWMSKIEYFRVV